jgi:preprotein translocase subunit SecY
MPYISASIIIQLLSIAVPAVQKLQKEGESGRNKINQWTRFLTIAITLVQAPGYLASTVVSVPGVVQNPDGFWWFSAVTILTCSTLLIMWLGERITDKGVGNGISLLIMIGIIATFPQAIVQEFAHPDTTLFFFLVELAFLLIVIGASVALVQAIRKGACSNGQNAASRRHVASWRRSKKLHPIESEQLGCHAHHLCTSHHVCAVVHDPKRDLPRKRSVAISQ